MTKRQSRNSENRLIDKAGDLPTPGQGSRSGGNLATRVGTRAELHAALGDEPSVACIYVASGRNIQFVAIVQYMGSRRTNRAVADFAFDTEHDVTEIDILAKCDSKCDSVFRRPESALSFG